MEMTAEEQLQKAMMDTYHLNMLFLSEFDNELFIRVNNLSNIIGNGEYKERYFLEFLKEIGDFDIYDSKEDTYLYNKEPKSFNNKAVVQTNYDLKNTINTLNQGFYNFEYDKKFEINEDENIFTNASKKLMNDFYDFKEELNCPIDRSKKKINKINKFMFIGTLLGRHIPKIMKKMKIKTFFVCENNLEIFRLSLFVCDYSALSIEGKRVVFSIMDDDDVLMDKLSDFLNMDVYNNAILKYYSTNHNIDNYFNRIIDRVLSIDPMSFNYYMSLDVVKNVSKNFFKYKSISLPLNSSIKSFNDKKILYLGAGPSLSDNINWLKENKDKFLIVTMAAALDLLYRNDIKPDIITTLDPQEHVIKQFFANKKSKEFIKDSIILASMNTNEKVLEELSSLTNLYLYEVLGSIQSSQQKFSASSIGEMTYSILSRFKNIKEIYLLGLDLALNQETGSTHSSEYEHNTKINMNKIDNIINEDFSIKQDIIKIKGNLQEEVVTSRLFYNSLRYYNLQAKKNRINTFNLSHHGAYIDNTIPTKLDSLKINNSLDINKRLLHEELIKDFDSIVVEYLNKKDLKVLDKQMHMIENIISKLDNNTKLKTYDDLNMLSNEIFVYITSDDSNINLLKEVYIKYTLSFNPYFSYCMLVMDKKKEKNIKEIIKVWKTKLIELLKEYKSYLENITTQNKIEI